MKKLLCANCYVAGYCLRRTVVEITHEEVVNNPQLVRAVRTFAYSLSISYSCWPDFMLILANNSKRTLVNYAGKSIQPNLNIFLPTDWEIDAGFADDDKFYNKIKEWFRSNCTVLVPDNISPYVRKEGMPRFCVLGNLLLCAFPKETINWPRRGIAANDNFKSPCQAANDNEPPA